MPNGNPRVFEVTLAGNQVLVEGNKKFAKDFDDTISWQRSPQTTEDWEFFHINFGVPFSGPGLPSLREFPIRGVTVEPDVIRAFNKNQGGGDASRCLDYTLYLRRPDGTVVASPAFSTAVPDQDNCSRSQEEPPYQLENEPNGGVGG